MIEFDDLDQLDWPEPAPRFNDLHLALAELFTKYTLKQHPHLRDPYQIVTAGSVTSGRVAVKASPSDANPSGHHPWVIPYTATSPPAPGDQMVRVWTNAGPMVIGKLSG